MKPWTFFFRLQFHRQCRQANQKGVGKNWYPSLSRLHEAVSEMEGIPKMKPGVFKNVLLHMGIKFQRR